MNSILKRGLFAGAAVLLFTGGAAMAQTATTPQCGTADASCQTNPTSSRHGNNGNAPSSNTNGPEAPGNGTSGNGTSGNGSGTGSAGGAGSDGSGSSGTGGSGSGG